MSNEKSKSYIVHAFVLVLAVILGVGVYFAVGQEAAGPVQESSVESSQPAQETPASLVVDLDIAAILKPRVLGDVNAPIQIGEYSSLTCGHCAHFHKTTFKELKEKYIDTGKAYLVMNDFPLNAPAMHATLAARCLPEDEYFDYVQMLFEEQDKWAFETSYIAFLKKTAMARGLSEAKFNACVGNPALQQGITDAMKAAQEKHGINSTPSFVIDDHEVLKGATGIDAFDKVLVE